MFYVENEISEHIKCPYCQNKYNDPRIVECSSSFCMPCIEFQTKDGANGFTCSVCDEFHQQPPKGYLKNFNLANLCATHAHPVSRGSLASTLNTQLDELKLKLDKLVIEDKLGIDKIKNYCDLLRNEVQLTSEQALESIRGFNLALIEQVDQYEKESMLNYDTKNEYKLNFEHFVSGMYDFNLKWSRYLKQFNLDDAELKAATTSTEDCLEKINKEHKQLLSKAFNGNVIKFVRNPIEISSSTIGTLQHEWRG